MLRAVIFRRNLGRNNTSLRLGSALCDALVEHCRHPR